MIRTTARNILCLWLLGYLSACAHIYACPSYTITPEMELRFRAHAIGQMAEGDQIAQMLDLAESKLGTDPTEALRLTRALGAGLHSNGIALDIEKSAFLREKAVALATDSKAEVETRIVAIGVLSYTTWSHHADDILPLLAANEPLEIQRAAIDALKLLDTGEFSTAIVSRWRALSAPARSHAVSILIERSEGALALLEAIGAGQIQRDDLDPQDVKQLQTSVNSEVNRVAKRVLPPL